MTIYYAVLLDTHTRVVSSHTLPFRPTFFYPLPQIAALFLWQDYAWHSSAPCGPPACANGFLFYEQPTPLTATPAGGPIVGGTPVVLQVDP